MDIALPKPPTKTILPRADHFSVLLLQGLESCDSNILNKVFLINNETEIKRTVAKLPVHCVVPLVNEVRTAGGCFTTFLHTHNLKGFSSEILLGWVISS
ncbi:hypothetical protein GDO78_020953 [Eleutherodactylus coqui]|nr:hypothetical protein GDO78_020953 [Eleutherodactylus coqui]